jgi:uncharacterized phage infection (PIP) family protein YhgE
MELQLKSKILPGEIQNNLDSFIEEVKKEVAPYQGLVFGLDETKEAKKTLANIRKYRTDIEDRRKRVKKEWLVPYQEFESKVKEAVSFIDDVIGPINEQISEAEERRKQDKRQALDEMIAEVISKQDERTADILDRCKWIYNEKWENASVSISQASKQLSDVIENTKSALSIIDDGSKYAGQAIGKFEETGNITEVIKYKKDLEERDKRYAEMEARKAEQEAEQAQQPEEVPQEEAKQPAPEPVPEPQPEDKPEEPVVTVTFSATGTKDQLQLLRQYCDQIGVSIGRPQNIGESH